MPTITSLCAAAAMLAAMAAPLAAQPRVMAGLQVATVAVSAFDARDTGIGVLVGARVLGPLWGEAALLRYPGGLGDRTFSRHRVEGLFGASAGPSIGPWRPFVKATAGFLRYGDAGGPLACIAIYPPPLSCTLAAGRTLAAYEMGGGLSYSPMPMTFVRLDVSRRFVRYPGPAFGEGGVVHDEDFSSGDSRFSVSAGVRF